MTKLFEPIQVGPYTLKHRVVMAPLTRMRSEDGDRPGELMVEYYTDYGFYSAGDAAKAA